MIRPSRHGSHHAPIIHLSHCHCAMIHSTDTVTLSKTTCCDVCATSWTRARRSIGGKPQPNRRVGPGMFDRLCMSMFSLLLLLGSISPAEIAQAHVVVVKGDLLAVPMPRSSSAKKLWQVLVWTSSQSSSWNEVRHTSLVSTVPRHSV